VLLAAGVLPMVASLSTVIGVILLAVAWIIS
jgi:hypothetical protein